MRVAEELLVLDARISFLLVREWSDATLIVRSRALADIRRRPITLEVRDRDDGCINRKLLVVCAKTMTMSVRIRKET